jgi:hypothetical protein
MADPTLVPLGEWESFYVIIGSSAAALTGLQFVVIALGSDRRRLAGEEAVGAFATPTIVHFGAVLLLAAIASTPRHTPATLAFGLTLSAVAGLVYVTLVVRRAQRQKDYVPVLEDWVWHAWLPLVGYALLLVASIMAWWHPEPALYVMGATALLLLFVGIHNAWDAAVYMATRDNES